jgi:AcrR family transcriptional regulator
MGITERRERERHEARTKILDAARELFAREGYDAVTMRRIADAIEYSPTAIYLHFKDKETLIRELCEEDFASLAKAFQKIAKEPDPLERLRKIGMAYVDFGIEKPNHYRLMFMSAHVHDPAELKELEKGNPEEDAYAFLVATVAEAIAKGRLRSELKDPHVVAQAAWAGVHGVISLHLAKKDDPWVEWRPLKKTAALVVDSMIDGFRRG